MIITRNPWKRSKILKSIQGEIERNIIPIRPGRKFVRNDHKSTQMDNRMNKKELYNAKQYTLIYKLLSVMIMVYFTYLKVQIEKIS